MLARAMVGTNARSPPLLVPWPPGCCTLCVASFTVAANTGNVGKHAVTHKHIDKEREAMGPGINAYFSAVKPPRVLSQHDRGKKTELVNRLRQLTHASIAGHSMPPNQISAILGKGSLIHKARLALDKEDVGLGAAGTMAVDLPAAERLLDARIAKRIKGVYGAIGQDGATFGDEHVLVLSFQSPQINCSILLDLIIPEVDEDYPLGDKRRYKYSAKRAAQDVKLILYDRFKMEKSQIVCAVGDNASFCSAFAREMDLVQGKDPAHGLALTVKQPMRKLQLVNSLVVQCSAALRAGGARGGERDVDRGDRRADRREVAGEAEVVGFLAGELETDEDLMPDGAGG